MPQDARKKAALAAEVNMSKPPRDRTSFGSDVYFVTASCWQHRSLFQTDHMANLFIDTMLRYRREGKFLLKELGLNLEVWERGYVDHRIRNADDYARHVGYVHQNPVEAKIISRAEDYLYSSAQGRFELDSCPQELQSEETTMGVG